MLEKNSGDKRPEGGTCSEAGDWEVMGTIKGLLGSPNSLLHALKLGGGNTANY